MDLGCGEGEMVRRLRELGYEAHGCDFPGEYSLMHSIGDWVSLIETAPYRLPYPDASFDVVVSTQVLEHVANNEDFIREIQRVLKPDGVTLHLFPSKWWLPFEVHLGVPFLSWMWPRVPAWWLALWAAVGVRNPYQTGFDWRRTTQANLAFCADGIDYRSKRYYLKLFSQFFARVSSPMNLVMTHGSGPRARFLRYIPLRGIVGELFGIFRQRLLVAEHPTPTT